MKISKLSLALWGVAIVAFSSGFYFSNAVAPLPTLAFSEQAAVPAHLTIAKAGVSAAVEQIGLTPDGALDTPQDPMNAGWFNLGPKPGEVGSSVIDGHYNWFNGAKGVFENLHLVGVGDTISVLDTNGVTTSFVVVKTQIYKPSADAYDVFASTDGKSHLNIITCEGVWDSISQNYSGRLVVFGDLK